jgi:branched-chain amino acid transport system substrate-binding protein
MSKPISRILSQPITRRTLGLGAGAALAAAVTPFNIVRAQGGPLKIGLILPRSGLQAQFGQSCQRGADIAGRLVRELGMAVDIELMSADTESNVDVARSRAERLIQDGAHMLIGAFDSGQTAAIAQVAEQHGVPLVINIAAADQITEQGYKFVFRNFATSSMLVSNALTLYKQLFAETGRTPKSAVFLHLNDTYGQSSRMGVDKIFPTMNFPFPILDKISYDPAAKDLSVEIAKAKSTGAELVMMAPRLNDAILLVREMVKQRWEPLGIITVGGPGMYNQQFFDALGKYSEYVISHEVWYNPNSRLTPMMLNLFKQQFPKDPFGGHAFNVTLTLEAFIICANAYVRAKSTNGKALADALRTTHITDRIAIGGPIQFNAKGQRETVQVAALQNRHLKPTVVLPKEAAELPPVFPMPGWASKEREESAKSA